MKTMTVTHDIALFDADNRYIKTLTIIARDEIDWAAKAHEDASSTPECTGGWVRLKDKDE